MAFWVWVDDSLLLSELIAGAVAASLGATLAELAQYQAATHLRLRSEWLGRLPGLVRQLFGDTWKLLGVLWRRLRGIEPVSGFREEPVGYGGNDAVSDTRRAVILGARSFAPNTLALGLDQDRDTLVVHQLVLAGEEPERHKGASR